MSSRTAPSATSRSNRRRAARSVIGAWRAASAGETQSWRAAGRRFSGRRFGRSLGATASRVSERRARSAARSRAEAAASAIAPAAAFGQAGSPGLGRRRPQATLGRDRGFSWRSAARAAASAAGSRGRGRTPRGREFRLRRLGRPGRRRTPGGGLGGRGDRIALPCASLQAARDAVRVHGQVERAAAAASRPPSRGHDKIGARAYAKLDETRT